MAQPFPSTRITPSPCASTDGKKPPLAFFTVVATLVLLMLQCSPVVDARGLPTASGPALDATEATFAAALANTNPGYGATVMLDPTQCSGDVLTLSPPNPFRATFASSMCAMFLSDIWGNMTIGQYAAQLANVQYTSSTGNRLQLTFHWVIQDFTGFQRMLINPSADVVYAQSITNATNWNAAKSLCTSLPSLPDINSIHAEDIIAFYGGRVAVDRKRVPPYPSPFDQELLTKVDRGFEGWWGIPMDNTPTLIRDCVSSASGQFQQVPCNGVNATLNLTAVVCESSAITLKGSQSFARTAAVTPGNLDIPAIYAPAEIDNGGVLGQVIFGGTFLQRATTCHPSDLYYLGNPQDGISVSFSGPCIIRFIGAQLASVYQSQIAGIGMKTMMMTRTLISHAFVWIKNRGLIDAAYSFGSGHIFTTFTNVWWKYPSQYPFRAAPDLCATYGMYPATIDNEEEEMSTLLLVTNRHPRDTRDMYIGFQQISLFQYYNYDNSFALPYLNWRWSQPPQTLTTDWNCAVRDRLVGQWKVANCSVRHNIMCELDAGNAFLSNQNKDLTFAAPANPPLGLTNWNPIPAFYSWRVFRASDLTGLNAVTLVYGVTVHLSPRQCVSASYTYSVGTLTAGVTTTIVTATCAIFFINAAGTTGANFVRNLLTLQFNANGLLPGQLSFSVVPWLNSGLDNMYHDVEQQSFFGRVNSGAVQLNASAFCTNLPIGGWTLAQPASATQLDLVNGITSSCVWLPMTRVRNGAYSSRKGFVQYNRWQSGRPANPTTNLCAQSCGLTGWTDAACNAVTTVTVCESTLALTGSTVVVWSKSLSQQNYRAFIGVLPVSTLPADDDNAFVHGATITGTMSASLCTAADRFAFHGSNSRIILVREDTANCRLVFRGRASIREYNDVVSRVIWIGFDTTRNSALLQFTWIYWESAQASTVERTASGTLHVALPGLSFVTNPSYYPHFMSGRDRCRNAGMTLSEITDATEDAAQGRIQTELGLTMLVGTIQRYVTGVKYFWDSGTSPVTYPSASWGASTTSWCGYKTGATTWAAFDCDVATEIQAVSCELSTATRNGIFTNTMTPRLKSWDTYATAKPVFIQATTPRPTITLNGMTVQIHPTYCDPATQTISLSATPGGLTATYVPSQCYLLVTGAAAFPAARDRYPQALEAVRVSSTDTVQKPVWAVAWMFFDGSYVGGFVDFETKHVYVSIAAAGASANDAVTQCTALTSGAYYVPTVTSKQEESVILQAAEATGYPLNLKWQANPGFFVWQNGEQITYLNWLATNPGSSIECAFYSGAGAKGWITTPCGVPIINRIICERDDFQHSGTIAFTGLTANWFTGTVLTVAPATIAVSLTANTDQTVIYGLTVQTRAVDCSTFDNFYATVVPDDIAQIVETPCMQMYAAASSVNNYNLILNSMNWRSLDNRARTSVKFGWVFWNRLYSRELVQDIDNARVYMSFGNSISRDGSADNVTLAAPAFCSLVSMSLTQVNSVGEALEFRRSLRNGPSFLDAVRSSSTAPFLWGGSTPITGFLDWTPQMPRSFTTNLCMRHEDGRGWSDESCSAQLGVSCETASWGTMRRGTAAVTLVASVPPDTTLRIANINTATWTMTGVIPSTHTAWMGTSSQFIFGATIQLTTHQCTGAESLTSSVSLPSGVTTTITNSICKFVFQGKQTVGNYKPLIESVNMITNEANSFNPRWTFGYAVWVQPFLDLTIEFETHSVLVPFSAPSVDWYGADRFCRLQGLGFQMIGDYNPSIHRLATVVAGQTVPMRFYRPNTTAGQLFQGWDDGVPFVPPYSAFAPGKPDSASSNLCAALDSTASYFWTDVPCNNLYTRTLCQSQDYDYLQNVSYNVDQTLLTFVSTPAGVITRSNPFTGLIPAANELSIHGMSAQLSARECSWGDRWVFNANHDQIVHIGQKDCVVYLAATLRITDYNTFLTNLRYISVNARRLSAKWSFVY
jgi:hypothetical protein